MSTFLEDSGFLLNFLTCLRSQQMSLSLQPIRTLTQMKDSDSMLIKNKSWKAKDSREVLRRIRSSLGDNQVIHNTLSWSMYE